MTSYPSLLNMPPIPLKPTKCELEGMFSSELSGVLEQLLSSYPDLNISMDLLKHKLTNKESVESAFLPKKSNTGIGHLIGLWRQDGVVGLLDALSGTRLKWLAGTLLSLYRISVSLQSSVHPHTRLTVDELLSHYSTTMDWPEAIIRCLAWHPHTQKLAVAVRDDTVRVAGQGADVRPMLRHAGQRDITCMAWKPYCASELAVGCRGGIAVWTVDPASVVSRPSANCVRLLSRPNHTPVTTIAWHPQGKLLASGSPADLSLIIWSVASEQAMPLRRVSGGGSSHVSWSPDGSRLLCATPGNIFRVWNTENWEADRWNVGTLKGRVTCGVWSPDSRHLLFASSDESLLYCLTVQDGADAAVAVLDLGEVAGSDQEDDGIVSGGIVQSLAWDREGSRLVIAFRSSPILAVFATRVGSHVSLTPSGWIRGQKGEFPSCMQFQPEFSDGGSVLTVCWSSGRVQHIPFIYMHMSVQTTRQELSSQSLLFSAD